MEDIFVEKFLLNMPVECLLLTERSSVRLVFGEPILAPTPLWAAFVAGALLIAAGLAATAAYYLASVEPAQLPEGPALCKGSRTVAWLFLMAAVSTGIAWTRLPDSPNLVAPEITLRVLHFAMRVLNAAICIQLVMLKRRDYEDPERFPLDIGVLSVFGSRTTVFASILDSAERQLVSICALPGR
jgi:hypothetical protein